MISKKQIKQLALSAAIISSTSIAFAEAPLWKIDDTTSIHGLINASVAFNDNIYLASSDKDSDVILTVTPGLEFVMGGVDARTTLTVRAMNDFVVYMDDEDNNSCLPHLFAGLTFKGEKLTASVNLGIDYIMQTSNRDYRDGELTRYWSYYGNAIGTYSLSERMSVMSGFKWTGTTYERGDDRYNDRQVYAVPVNLYHTIASGKMKAGLSYEYRYTDLAAYKGQTGSPGYQQVHFIGVTAQGRITEKFNLDGRIGYTTSDWSRDSYNRGRENTMGMTIGANYTVTEKTGLNLKLSRDFEISGNGAGITSTGVQLGATHKLNDKWSLNGMLSYKLDDYNQGGREDDVYTGRVGCVYQLNELLSFNASYSIQWDDSNAARMDYTNNIVTVGLNFRY